MLRTITFTSVSSPCQPEYSSSRVLSSRCLAEDRNIQAPFSTSETVIRAAGVTSPECKPRGTCVGRFWRPRATASDGQVRQFAQDISIHRHRRRYLPERRASSTRITLPEWCRIFSSKRALPCVSLRTRLGEPDRVISLDNGMLCGIKEKCRENLLWASVS
jgi:hypothetical protein